MNKKKLIQKAFSEIAARLFAEEVPLEASDAGKEIITLIDQVGPTMIRDLAVYSSTMKSENYVPRIFSFSKSSSESLKTKDQEWVCHRVEVAGPEYMTGSPGQLRSVMDKILAEKDGPGIAVWTSPMAGESNRFYVFLRHRTGQEAQAIITQTGWSKGPCNKEMTDVTLAGLLTVQEDRLAAWKSIMSQHSDSLSGYLRQCMRNTLGHRRASDLSDKEWDDICLQFVISEGNLRVLQEAARKFGGRVIVESQLQLEIMCQSVNEASDHFSAKKGQLEKDQQRVLTKFRADIAAEKDSSKLKDKRIATLSGEISVLRRKQHEKSTGTVGAESTIGMALDELFA